MIARAEPGDIVDCYQPVHSTPGTKRDHPLRTRVVRVLGAHHCTISVDGQECRVNRGACKPVEDIHD